MENDEPEGKWVKMWYPPAFVEKCERLHIDLRTAASRLMQLAVEVDKDAQQLVPGWRDLPKEEQLRITLDNVSARFALEYPGWNGA